MPQYKYTANTPAKAALKRLSELMPSVEGCERNDAIAFHQQIVDSGGTALDMAKNTPKQGWAYWSMMMMGRECDPELRKASINVIKDPMMAFLLYLNLDFLTDEEDKLLEEKFKSKLPTAEKELADGIVTRAKVK